MRAQLERARAHHLPVVVADRDVLMERVDDGGLGAAVAYLADERVAEELRVLYVHDIRTHRHEEVADVFRVEVGIGHGAVEVVVLELVCVEHVLVVCSFERRQQRAAVHVPEATDRRASFRHEDRLVLGSAAKGAEHLVRVRLGAARLQRRVRMADEQELQPVWAGHRTVLRRSYTVQT